MANEIVQRQNDPRALQLLAAQRRLYSRGKNVAAFQIALVVVLPALLIVAEHFYPSIKFRAASIALVVAVLDVLVFERWKDSVRARAAATQELFDCYVLTLEWPALKAKKPDREDIEGLAQNSKAGPLKDWYPPAIATLPLEAARIVCQRSNCRWDSRLRRLFRIGLLACAAVLVIVAVFDAIIQNLRFDDFVLIWMAPILPIALWCVREADMHTEAAERATRLKEFSDDLWGQALKKAGEPELLAAQSRRLQDEIFEHRQRSPLVFDWFYKLLRSRFESQMHHSAEAMIDEVNGHRL